MAHVIVPQKKIMSRSFLNSGTLIVIAPSQNIYLSILEEKKNFTQAADFFNVGRNFTWNWQRILAGSCPQYPPQLLKYCSHLLTHTSSPLPPTHPVHL
jgi:hypothetical protein